MKPYTSGSKNTTNWKTRRFIKGLIIGVVIAIIVVVIIYLAASSQRLSRYITDVKSNFGGGLYRVINIYTADGQKIASYEGKIDINESDGGVVKFDYEGKRYIYYNCFVESIADI